MKTPVEQPVTTTRSGIIPITVAYGDGIGPEIMTAVLKILNAAGAQIVPEPVEIGEKVFMRGVSSGIEKDSWDSLRRTRVFLKAPITTPQGGGFKSLNVTTRKTLGLFANIRPCRSLHPFIETKHPDMDVVIVRENEEDTYGGIEHRQTDEVTQCLKLISRPGCEKIVRYAFEYARHNSRKKVTCFSKDNIMKLTDGLFHKVFDEIAKDYPDIENEHLIVDIGAARLADTPEAFDVIVMPNLYGDILSDVAAQIAGSVGMGGSANIGSKVAMFEAIHGSAPAMAGKDIANPSGLLQAAVMMLVHINQTKIAEHVQNAWLRTIEDGIHTADIMSPQATTQAVGTAAFADAVIARLGKSPRHLKTVSFGDGQESLLEITASPAVPAQKELVGIDVFLHWTGSDRNPVELGQKLESLSLPGVKLKMITNRGVMVYPQGFPETFCTDHWRCRFVSSTDQKKITPAQLLRLLATIDAVGLEFIKTEHLYTFDGVAGYSLGQGE